jgi:hypothetical protein
MNDLTPAQASAQFISLIVLVTGARWYVIPQKASVVECREHF